MLSSEFAGSSGVPKRRTTQVMMMYQARHTNNRPTRLANAGMEGTAAENGELLSLKDYENEDDKPAKKPGECRAGVRGVLARCEQLGAKRGARARARDEFNSTTRGTSFSGVRKIGVFSFCSYSHIYSV